MLRRARTYLSPRVWRLLPILASLVLCTLLLALILVTATKALEPPPFAYRDAAGALSPTRVTTYQPIEAALCPGALLRFAVSFDVTDVPVVIGNTTAIRSRATGRSVPGTLRSLNPPVPYSEPTQLRDVTVGITLPLAIAPGAYLFVFVAQAAGRLDNAFHVPFTVVAPCAAGHAHAAPVAQPPATLRRIGGNADRPLRVGEVGWLVLTPPDAGAATACDRCTLQLLGCNAACTYRVIPAALDWRATVGASAAGQGARAYLPEVRR